MPEKQVPSLYPQDRVLKVTILPFIPDFVQPNHITIVRMLMTPIILWFLSIELYVWALPLFFIAGMTDMLDGALARTRDKITPWGIFFDPIADKLLVGSVALLVGLHHFHPWLVLLAIFLDILPSIRWASHKTSGGIMAANKWGKTKMVLQCTALGLLLLGIVIQIPAFIVAGEVALAVSIFFAIIALVTYSL